MHFDQLLYFTEVYRQKSIHAASRNLNISQQSLSSSIRNLEEEFATTFFTRTPTGVLPTFAGDLFYASASSMINEYYCVKKNLSDQKDFSSCSIGLYTSLSTIISSQLFQLLTDRFPNIFFNITTFSYYDVMNLPISQYPDIIFSLIPKEDEALISQKISQSDYHLKYISNAPKKFYIWTSVNSPLAQKSCVSIDDLRGLSFVFPKFITYDDILSPFFSMFDLNKCLYYFCETENIFKSLLKKGNYITTEIHSNGQPLIFPNLLSDSALTLKPLSKEFFTSYPVLIYKKKHELFYPIIADHLIQTHNI